MISSMNQDPPNLHFPRLLGWQACTSNPRFFPLTWGLTNISPNLDWNSDTPYLTFLCSGDDRHTPVNSAIGWDFVSLFAQAGFAFSYNTHYHNTDSSSMEIPWKAKDRTGIWSSDTTIGHLPKSIQTGYRIQ
jgi:hypothetical protein